MPSVVWDSYLVKSCSIDVVWYVTNILWHFVLKVPYGKWFPRATFSAKLCASRFSKYLASLMIPSFVSSFESDVDGVVKKGLSFPLEKEGVVGVVDDIELRFIPVANGIPKSGDCTLE